MNIKPTALSSRLSVLLAATLTATACISGAGTLWQIGSPDRKNAEFALAPRAYAAFSGDPLFVVGTSDPKSDWPYVHPGPSDHWAGGGAHTFTVLFGVTAARATGNCTLTVDLLDAHSTGPPLLRIEINGQTFERRMPPGAGDASVQGDPARGKPHRFSVEFPAATLKAGTNQLDITNAEGSWMLYDSLALTVPEGVESAAVTGVTALREVRAQQVLVERNGQLWQPVTASLVHYGAETEAELQVHGTAATALKLRKGSQSVEALLPAVEKETPAELKLIAGGKTLASRPVTLKPVRRWTVYVLIHSHVDIGYTDIQPNIEKKQAQNVARSLELIRESRDNAAGSRFKWNLEVLWAADQFLRTATPEQKRAFEEAIRNGDIGVDAMYGNLLTGLCRGEELERQLDFAEAMGRRCGVEVDSMMISDVPGLTWGLVPALAHHGVKYISNGPNAQRGMEGDRIGYVRVQWEHRPFYWQSPSGMERALYWGAQGGYSLGHHFNSITAALPFLLQRVEEQAYAYDIVQMRWTKGDNGPPDEGVVPAVKAWNAKYAWPKLIIATTSEAFRAFEQEYGSRLPVFRGDLTPYWEDGAPSSAQETALNRHTADRLVQTETLWALRRPGPFPAHEFDEAWKNTALYSEHTWGAHNSISQPDLPFVAEQWKYKKGYALDADKQSRALLDKALGAPAGAASQVDVINTNSWTRTGLVTLPQETAGNAVTGDDGKPAPSQRLTTGELVFLARDVPAFGARRFTIAAGKPAADARASVNGLTLSTPALTVKLDPATGDIVSLRRHGSENELAAGPVNNYLYLPGADVKGAQPSGTAKVVVRENGPLVVSLVAESAAPGCRALSREVRLVDGLDFVGITDVVDKAPVRTVEGVHFGFSFNVANPRVRLNSPGTVGEPDKDQLPGACKNWFCVERWVDVSNDGGGVTWATADAPLVQIGGLTANLPRGQPNPNAYLKSIAPSPKLYAWVMNNHWHTNYRADQEGPVTFRFALRPHGGYDAAAAARFGVESTVPLLVAAATGPAPPPSRLTIEPPSVVATSLRPAADGAGLALRLSNPSSEPQTVRVKWNPPVRRVILAGAAAGEQSEAPEQIRLPGLGSVELRADP